ncbi:helix-turn-helix domain-containing protein [Phytoactinopolyspora endophytica]|uniref:helix-turn-helix domain-containing protein n=1 Tax=Phytoactinopolyspora endophytica TaxID=1642495 RepID=UPI0013E9FF8F|nr:helix-turn-helix transcriptional regulator [Phytoactinopolyspora endophytica]
MSTSGEKLRIISAQRHEAEDVSWAFARCLPRPALAGDVVGYTGYAEHALRPVRRREVPSARVPVIISFGDTIHVQMSGYVGPADANAAQVSRDGRTAQATAPGLDAGPSVAPLRLTSFVAGFGEAHAITEYTGAQRGIQIDLTPLGAYRLLGLTGDEIRTGVLQLDDVLGSDGPRLVDRLVSAPDWPARFDLVDGFLLGRSELARVPDPAIAWCWDRMRRTDGRVSVGELVEAVGWSRKHLGERFRRHVGLGPKPAARVLRFARAVSLLDGSHSISEVAAECGYADHSHLVRDVQALAGCTPSELIAERS